MGGSTKWQSSATDGHSQWYIERFRKMAADGADLAGEARLIDAMAPRGARILDAGCGPGRVGGELHARGHTVVGVDIDPALIEAAQADHPGPKWLVGDLAELDLAPDAEGDPFDAIVVAGNVMAFLADSTHEQVLRNLAAHLRPDGFVVVGFGTGRGYPVDEFERDVAAAGLRVEHRFLTWDLKPWRADSPFLVAVLRHTEPDA